MFCSVAVGLSAVGRRPALRSHPDGSVPVQARGYDNVIRWRLQLIPLSPGSVGGSGKFCHAPAAPVGRNNRARRINSRWVVAPRWPGIQTAAHGLPSMVRSAAGLSHDSGGDGDPDGAAFLHAGANLWASSAPRGPSTGESAYGRGALRADHGARAADADADGAVDLMQPCRQGGIGPHLQIGVKCRPPGSG